MSTIRIFDHLLAKPGEYRAQALAQEFKTYDFGHCVFHGIAAGDPARECLIDWAPARPLVEWIRVVFPMLKPDLTFFRKSPLGQEEPNDIHTDIDMGDWTALLYLNPEPPEGDGTTFWTHRATQTGESTIPHERSVEGRDRAAWDMRRHVAGRYNRLLMFRSSLFHSRAILENYGAGDGARLVQVVFGKGEFV
jgi:hypothetical protein